MAPPDLATIRLVTQRYRELQGLRLVWSGAVNMTVFGAFLVADGPSGLPPSLVGFFVCLSHTFINAYLNQYYRTRFGLVDERGESAWIVKGLFGAGLAIGVATLWTGGPVGLMFVPWAFAHLWIAVRDFPRRTHHLIGAAGSLVATAMLWAATDGAPASAALGQALTLHGASLVPTGLLDHRLLSHTMRVPPSEEAASDPT